MNIIFDFNTDLLISQQSKNIVHAVRHSLQLVTMEVLTYVKKHSILSTSVQRKENVAKDMFSCACVIVLSTAKTSYCLR